MGAEFHDASFMQYGDAVGVADGGDPVRDKDGRTSSHDLAKVVQDFFFGVGIDAR